MRMSVLQMTPRIIGPSVRMGGMVPVLVTGGGDIASDTCVSQGAVFQHIFRRQPKLYCVL